MFRFAILNCAAFHELVQILLTQICFEFLTLVGLFTDVLRSAFSSPGIRRVRFGCYGPVGCDAQPHLEGGDYRALIATPFQNGIIQTAVKGQLFGNNVQSQTGR